MDRQRMNFTVGHASFQDLPSFRTGVACLLHCSNGGVAVVLPAGGGAGGGQRKGRLGIWLERDICICGYNCRWPSCLAGVDKTSTLLFWTSGHVGSWVCDELGV